MLTVSRRGIGNLVLSALSESQSRHSKPVHFYSSSGGNAGLACVTAATSLGYPATVVVPNSTKPSMIAKLKIAGATDVVQIGASWKEADAHLREVVLPHLKEEGEEEGVYVPPFDHPKIWEGNATLVDEIHSQLPDDGRPDAIICSVGGGGLFIGVMQGLEKFGWNDVPVLAMETAGADSLSNSLKHGENTTLPGITSIATSLGAVRVADKAFEDAQKPNVKSVVLSDAEAAMGTWRLADDERLLVEPACGVSVAPCYDGRLKKLLPHLTPDSRVVVIVCGGSNATLEMVSAYRQVYGYEVESTKDTDVPSTHSRPEKRKR